MNKLLVFCFFSTSVLFSNNYEENLRILKAKQELRSNNIKNLLTKMNFNFAPGNNLFEDDINSNNVIDGFGVISLFCDHATDADELYNKINTDQDLDAAKKQQLLNAIQKDHLINVPQLKVIEDRFSCNPIQFFVRVMNASIKKLDEITKEDETK